MPSSARTFLILMALVSGYHNLIAQEKNQPHQLELIQPKELQQDFDQLVEIMQQHPARTIFTSDYEWKEIISSQKARLSSPMTTAEFFDVCAQVIHRIRCGHTGLDLPDNFFKKVNPGLFPIPVKIINDSLFVIEKINDIPVRSSIISINDKPFSEILSRLRTYISADGMNTTWTILRLNQNLNNYLSLYFNFTADYKITYGTPSELTEKTITLQAIPSNEFKSAEQPKMEPLTYKVLKENHTALMGIHSFNYYRKDSVTFFHTINDYFNQAYQQGIQNLIIDFRGNSGGDPFCAAHLLSYLSNKSFVYYADNYDWCPQLSKPYPPKSKSFKGNLFVLTDGMCFSTTGHIGSLMKVNKVGTLIGDEMGGTYTCNDSGKWFELKKSGLRLRMARQSFRTTATSLPRQNGVIPDHLVKPDSKAFVNKQDPVLDYALKMIGD